MSKTIGTQPLLRNINIVITGTSRPLLQIHHQIINFVTVESSSNIIVLIVVSVITIFIIILIIVIVIVMVGITAIYDRRKEWNAHSNNKLANHESTVALFSTCPYL